MLHVDMDTRFACMNACILLCVLFCMPASCVQARLDLAYAMGTVALVRFERCIQARAHTLAY